MLRVFISWSGELSHQIAEAFRKWLPSALQYVKPYFSPSDIEKGARWASEITKELSASSICIIILTPDNLNSKWIMFESGAVSKTLEDSRVCPILFEIDSTDVEGPLSQFQITKFKKSDIKRLFLTINSASPESVRLEPGVVESVFEKWWPDLEGSIASIVSGYSKPAKDVRSDRDLIEEILLLLRSRPIEISTRPPVPYEASAYKHLIDMLHNLWANSSMSNEDEQKFLEEMGSLQRIVGRRVSGETRDKLLRDIELSISSISKFLKDRSPDADDDIPF